MGPLASAHFLSLIVSHTLAGCDGDHIDIVMTSRASTPDRTAHLLGKSRGDPLISIKKDVDALIFGGAELIAVPCNTAMAYYGELSSYSRVPVMNIVKLAAERAAEMGAKSVCVFATSGTIMSGIYQRECEKVGVRCIYPSEQVQSAINDIIYRKIKSGAYKVNEIYPLFDQYSSVSDAIILGCTELSLIDLSNYINKNKLVDSSRVLAENAIISCGGTPTGF